VDQIDAKARDKCLKEVRLLQSLDHPNIIRYLDSFISENDLVIVVEWAAAGDLKRQLRKAQERGVGFEERIIWKYFAQIADAMKHMHERRIMHRDLKPANIFLTLDGTVKVGDLGLSRELSEHTVQAHSKVGTPLYMSPEVLRGDGYDFKSDVWSLGCILYELAMLKSPFKAEGLNLYGLFQKISAGDFQPIPENYSDELRSLVYACMSAKAEDRPEISSVCEKAAVMREKSAKQRANRNSSAGGNSASGAGPPEGQGPVPPQTRVRSSEKSSRPTSTTSHRNETGSEGVGLASDAKETPSRTNSGRKSARSAATPPVNVAQGGGNENFLADYKFHGNGEDMGLNALADKDSVVRIPSANSVSRPDSKGGSRHEMPVIGSSQGSRGQNGTQIDDDDGSGSSSALVPLPGAVQPQLAPATKPRGAGFSRPDSAGRGRRTGAERDGFAGDRRGPAIGGGGFDGRPGSQQGRGDRPGSRGGDGGLDGARLGGGVVRDTGAARRVEEADAWAPSVPKKTQVKAHNSPNSEAAAPTKRTTGGTSAPRRVTPEDDFVKTDVLANLDISGEDRETVRSAGVPMRRERGGSAGPVDPAKFAQMNASSELMDLLYVKLTILGYPFRKGTAVNAARRALTPLHFICDLTILGGRDNVDSSQQFRRFVQLVVWLCTELGQDGLLARWDMDTDSPMLLAKQVLLVSQASGVPTSVLSADNIPPSSLLPGYGEKVCLLLSALADCLLARRQYKFQPLVHAEADDAEALLDGADVADEDNALEEIEDIEVVDAGAEEEASGEHGQSGGRGGHSQAAGQSMIFTAADPVLWREETDRVGRQLRAPSGSSGSWLTHFEVMKDFVKKNGTVGSEMCSGNVAELTADMKALDRQLADHSERIGRFENSMSLSGPLAALGSSFGVLKHELTGLEDRVAVLTKSLEDKGGSWMELESEFEGVQDRYQEKYGDISGSSGDTSGAGGNVLVKVKSAIRQIKSEISHLAVREGVCANSLLQLRVAQQNASRKERDMYYKKKRVGKKRGKEEVSED